MKKIDNIFSKEYESKNQTQESDKPDHLQELIKQHEIEKEEEKYSISKPRREIIRAIIVHDKN